MNGVSDVADEVTKEDIMKKLEEIRKCTEQNKGSCSSLQDELNALKSQHVEEQGKEIPQEHKDYFEKCIGTACENNRKKIMEEDIPKANDEWHTKYAQEHAEEPPEEPPKDFCWECSKDKPSGQNVRLGGEGCSHGN